MSRDVIIDCDTGMDDALALLLALRSPEFNVLGITCVNGNVGLDKVVNNTLRVVEHSGKDVPVFAGCAQTLMCGCEKDSSAVHGGDGLCGLPFPAPEKKAETEHAVDFIIRTLMEAPKPMDWITLGPLTNAAMAIRKEPRILEKVSLLTMMAGGVDAGNASLMGEFNVYFDSEAARIVFDSHVPKMMVPLDPLWNGGFLSEDNIEKIKTASTKPWCEMAGMILDKTVERMAEHGRFKDSDQRFATPPDLLAVAVAIDPSIAQVKNYPVFVETGGEYTRGMTVVDRRWFAPQPTDPDDHKVAIALSADQPKYANLVLNTWLND